MLKIRRRWLQEEEAKKYTFQGEMWTLPPVSRIVPAQQESRRYENVFLKWTNTKKNLIFHQFKMLIKYKIK